MLKHPNPFGIEIAISILGKTKTNIPNKGKTTSNLGIESHGRSGLPKLSYCEIE